jgi:hypothetical protein
MTYEFISMIADISLALSLVVALGFGIVQVRQAARDRRERFTIETLRNLQTREFAEVEGQLTYHKSPSNFEEFKQLSLNEQTKFIQFSQEMESLGILVAEGLVDIDLIDKTLGLFVITSWQKYKKVFEEIRQKFSDPFLGEYFQWLAEYINDRMKKEPRKPFYETHRFNS